MKRIISLAGLAFASVRGQTTVTLSLLHYNDVHARVEKVQMGGSPCGEGDECYGGLAKVATVIKNKRNEAVAANHIPLVLDAGDQFMGTVWNTFYRGDALGPLHNMMAIDAFTFGNHEFDFGPAVLSDFVKQLETSIVACNVDFSKDPNFADVLEKITPHVVLSFDVDVGGGQLQEVKIAVVGYVTEDSASLSSPGDDIVFTPAKDAIPDCIREAMKEADAVVLLGHSGYEVDKEIAEMVAADDTLSGVLAIVGGHSHTPLGSMDGAQEGHEYPTLVEGIPVVQAYFGTIYMGAVTDIEFTVGGGGTKKNKITRVNGTPITLSDDPDSPDYVPDDVDVAAKIAELAVSLDEFRLQNVSYAVEFLDGERESVRYTETNLAQLICDALLWKVNTTSLPEEHGVITTCLTQGGGIRASIHEGDVTVEEILTVLPFGNQMAVLEILGSDLRAAMEEGVSKWVVMGSGDLDGRYPHVGGMKIIFDGDAEPLSRITSFEMDDGGELQDLDDDKKYMLVTNEFLAAGGDGYTSLTRAELISGTVALMSDALGEYMADLERVEMAEERRLLNSAIDKIPGTSNAALLMPLAAFFCLLTV